MKNKISKLLSGVVAVSLCVSVLAGCADKSTSSDVNAETSQADSSEISGADEPSEDESGAVIKPVVDLPDEIKAYIENEGEYSLAVADSSVYSIGNCSRLKEKIEEMRSGESTVIAYIGGSITEGVGAPNKDSCYAKLSYDHISETYGTGENVEYVNAGLSGTSSTVGIVRVQKDVLSKTPDIVFIEFAVNDGCDTYSQDAYESLVRACLESENAPAVVLIFNRLENGYTAQEHMKEIGCYYGLPMISVADATTPLLDSGELAWKTYSNDSSHPNKYGHRLISGFIADLFATVDLSEPACEYAVPENKSVYLATFSDIAVVTPSVSENGGAKVVDTGSFTADGTGTFGFSESWQLGEGSEPLTITANTSSFIIAYKRNKDGSTGKFDVRINGTLFKTIDTNQSGGWGEAYAEVIIRSDSASEKTIEIAPSEDNDGKPIDILAIGTSN